MKTFGEPVNKFKDNVTATEARMETLKNNLEDLRNHSENAQQMVNILIFPFFLQQCGFQTFTVIPIFFY